MGGIVKILVVLLIAFGAYKYMQDRNTEVHHDLLVGTWVSNMEKTQQSMRDKKKIPPDAIRKVGEVIEKWTYIFTEKTMDARSASFRAAVPEPYQVEQRSYNSITIAYTVKLKGQPRKTERTTFYFTKDKQCIYTVAERFNDYFCKS